VGGVAERLVLVPHLSRAEVADALAAASVWALPSRTENFALAAVEALAAGVPAVLAPAVNIARDVERYGAGVVADAEPRAFADAIRALFEDDPTRAARARAFARRYDADVVARDALRMYERTLVGAPLAEVALA
jgi:glycosyltransferase involved in cell wall biosynthesis